MISIDCKSEMVQPESPFHKTDTLSSCKWDVYHIQSVQIGVYWWNKVRCHKTLKYEPTNIQMVPYKLHFLCILPMFSWEIKRSEDGDQIIYRMHRQRCHLQPRWTLELSPRSFPQIQYG